MSSAEPEVDLLTSIERGEAPRRILEFAARGFVPLPPSELVRAVGTILASGDAELGPLAEETFKGFSPEDLKRSVLSDHVRPEQLDVIARRTSAEAVLEPLIRHHSVSNLAISSRTRCERPTLLPTELSPRYFAAPGTQRTIAQNAARPTALLPTKASTTSGACFALRHRL